MEDPLYDVIIGNIEGARDASMPTRYSENRWVESQESESLPTSIGPANGTGSVPTVVPEVQCSRNEPPCPPTNAESKPETRSSTPFSPYCSF
ncbi:hypothetical protein HPB48_003126 [Haemaphysalis longicornis]|uniref:Uncharacterized protein n=1 Tax=Haemaphysalis longicornis TaxID=44386 RepID=A0A9J6GYW6_HAELO|nr:hypothetical protein HPB48_003126 [Haemaphysalis longicornis]